MEAAVTKPLIVITGPTASGKTELALKLAERYDGEIICADSRTVYRGLDIGTAKPTADDRARVPHHLLDVVKLDEPYNLARFQQEAKVAIAEIRTRGHVPFLVGGSGLYIDSVILDYKLDNEPDLEFRTRLESMSVEQLRYYCIENNIAIPENDRNKRYLIRAIEQGGINSNRTNMPDAYTHVVGIISDEIVLKKRMGTRAKQMFDHGLIEEADDLARQYGWNVPPLKSPAYDAVRRLINNEVSYEEAVAQLARSDWQLARKQMTWMRRNSWIHWLTPAEVEGYVRSVLV